MFALKLLSNCWRRGFRWQKIAEQTGYRDSGSLIRVFKKVTGMTPGQYKAAHSEE
mgnify:CR=1 FL=1